MVDGCDAVGLTASGDRISDGAGVCMGARSVDGSDARGLPELLCPRLVSVLGLSQVLLQAFEQRPRGQPFFIALQLIEETRHLESGVLDTDVAYPRLPGDRGQGIASWNPGCGGRGRGAGPGD